MNRLHAFLIDDYSNALGGPLCTLSAASTRFARLHHRGRKAQAEVAWTDVMLGCAMAWSVVRDWRAFMSVDELPYTASRRALLAAVAEAYGLPAEASEEMQRVVWERLRIAVLGEGRQ